MIEIRPSGDRILTRMDWLQARGSFPMGHHPRDPENTHFGLLYVHQEDRIAPHSGFPTHPHAEVEVVTWVLEGALEHRDSGGGEGVIGPGQAQHMSAGAGIHHSEMNPYAEEAHLVQMWVAPDQRGGEPYYSDVDLTEELGGGELALVASGREADAPAKLRQQHATLWAARPEDNPELDLPEAPFLHLFCTRGSLRLDDRLELAQGDAARIRGGEAHRVSAAGPGAELLLWEMHAELDLG